MHLMKQAPRASTRIPYIWAGVLLTTLLLGGCSTENNARNATETAVAAMPTHTNTATNTPTAEPSLTPTLPINLETVIAQTLAAQLAPTLTAAASLTPNLGETAAVVLGATGTARAIESFTATPLPTLTRTATDVPTATLPLNLETVIAATLAAREAPTLTAAASLTPDFGATAEVILGATETLEAIASFTKTPTPSHTPTFTPSATLFVTPAPPYPGARLVYGPASAELVHDSDTSIETFPRPPYGELANLLLRARISNPTSPDQVWATGFRFRANNNAEYRLAISANRQWDLTLVVYTQGDPQFQNVQGGAVASLIIDEAAFNDIELRVQGAEGYLTVNGVLVAVLNLSEHQEAGAADVATGMFARSEFPNSVTLVQDFTIWELTEAVALASDGTPGATRAAPSNTPTPAIAVTERPDGTATAEARVASLRPPVDGAVVVFGPVSGASNASFDPRFGTLQNTVGQPFTDFILQARLTVPQVEVGNTWAGGFLIRGSRDGGIAMFLSNNGETIAFIWAEFTITENTDNPFEFEVIRGELIDQFNISPDGVYAIELEVDGNNATLFLNGRFADSLDISRYPRGDFVQLYAQASTRIVPLVQVEDLVVWSLPPRSGNATVVSTSVATETVAAASSTPTPAISNTPDALQFTRTAIFERQATQIAGTATARSSNVTSTVTPTATNTLLPTETPTADSLQFTRTAIFERQSTQIAATATARNAGTTPTATPLATATSTATPTPTR